MNIDLKNKYDPAKAWEINATFWDDYMGDDGNSFHQKLIGPTTERLLNIRPGQQILDIACGNGNFSRRLAKLGAIITAIDVSKKMIERAIERSNEFKNIHYLVMDVTDEKQLKKIEKSYYDAAVCNMALMDIQNIEPLIRCLNIVLKPNSVFVFSVMHPCFSSPRSSRVIEETDIDGVLTEEYSIKITSYITPKTIKGLAINGQPVPQYYYHRSLTTLFKYFFKNGFMINALEEPIPKDRPHKRKLSQSNFIEIPWALIVRMCKK